MYKSERERLIKQMNDAAKKLGVPTMADLRLKLSVEKAGEILHRHDEIGHSWTRNGWNAFFGMNTDAIGDGLDTFGAGYMSAKRTSGVISDSSYVPRRANGTPTTAGFINEAGSNDHGIIVGTGDTAFSPEDYRLASMIAHGAGAGQLYSQIMNASITSYNAGTKIWTTSIARLFENQSGDSVVVKEVGLVWKGYCFDGSANSFLLARDVLEVPVVVPHGSVLSITYELSKDFSAID